MRRIEWTIFKCASLAVGALAMSPVMAHADYPGALWSVQMVEVSGADHVAPKVRAGLRNANEIYFHGDRAVKMRVKLTGANSMRLSLVDAKTGMVLVRSGRTSVGADSKSIAAGALAWMDTLQCAAIACDPSVPASTAIAAAPKAEPSFPAQARLARAEPLPAETADAEPGAAIMRAAPAQPRVAIADLKRTRISRNPDASLKDFAKPIRIARFNTNGLGQISYNADDRLVLADPTTAVPGAVAATSTPRVERDDSRTVIGRWLSSVGRFFGFSSEPAPRPAAVATRPSSGAAPAGNVSQTPVAAAFRPSTRWEPASADPPVIRQDGTQIAALGTSVETNKPGARSSVAPPPGLRVVLSPGLRTPVRASELAPTSIVTPIRFTRANVGQAKPERKDKLVVKLDPEIFNTHSPAAAQRLFGSYRNDRAKVRLVADTEETRGNGSVDGILAARGLALASDKYARAERIFWTGNSGSRGFWISLPTAVPSSYVLIASSKASVIANVHQRGTRVRVSDAVAETLGLRVDDWSDVQVVALRQLSRTARRASGSATQ